MSTETLSFPWQSAIQELALQRSRTEWAAALEYLAVQLAEAERCYFFVWDDPQWIRPATGDRHRASEDSLVGVSWSQSEPVQRSRGEGELVTGVPALSPCAALPVRSFGRIIGLLTLEKLPHSLDLATWEAMLSLLAYSWDTVGKLEDFNAYQQQTEEVLRRAVESLPAQRTGHVQRVAQTASELGRLLDLSAHQRQRLFRAGVYHDVGLLLNSADHAKAGADFLRAARTHADLAELVEHHHHRFRPELQHLALEVWVLALAEHFQEYCEAQESLKAEETMRPATIALGLTGAGPAVSSAQADRVVQTFAIHHAADHHPAVLDALVGLSVSGKLETLLPVH